MTFDIGQVEDMHTPAVTLYGSLGQLTDNTIAE